jgi:mycobactin peptide synthetase MbtE
VVDAVSPVRSLSRNPLFGVVVHVREELPADRVIDSSDSGDQHWETRFTALEPTFDVAHADLSLNFFATASNGYQGTVIYRTELYQPVTAQRLVDWLLRVIDAFAHHPDHTLRDIAIGDAEAVAQWSAAATPEVGLPQTAGADQVFVLDDWLAPVGVGVIGDVYHAGGAIDEAQRNAAPAAQFRYPVNPFAPGTRLYRTGDRARWTEDGTLEYVERGDHRVQAALEAIDGVAAALTRNWTTRAGSVLAGYVVPAHPQADIVAFADTVRAALPEELAGLRITVLDTLDGATLPRPVLTASGPFEPAATDTERTLAAMLTALLGVEEFGRHDDFFTLGGDSILAVQLAARARDNGMALTARMVFEHPVLAELAAALDAKAGQVRAQDTHHAPMAASGLSADELAELTAGWQGP